MPFRPLSIPGSFEFTPVQFADDRGVFLEWFRDEAFAEVVGHPLVLRQANTSVSRRGVLRGIHFADVPAGQAKYVTATRGSVIDFVIDIRVGSPTFGQWDSVLLDTVDRRAIYLAEGLGHAFVALEDDSTVSYLCSDVFRPEREHGIDPLDASIGLAIPAELGAPILSEKDAKAPSLADAAGAGLLPTWEACRARYDELAREGGR